MAGNAVNSSPVAKYIQHQLESRTRKERRQIEQLEETAPEKTARKEKKKQWNSITNAFAPKADEESQNSNRATRHNNSSMDPQGFPHYSTKAEMEEFVKSLGTKGEAAKAGSVKRATAI
jgi:hypothetical protein